MRILGRSYKTYQSLRQWNSAECFEVPLLLLFFVLLQVAIEVEFERVVAQHAALAGDSRTRTALQVAALALATHKALLPWLSDERVVLEIVKDHMGAHTNPFLKYVRHVQQ